MADIRPDEITSLIEKRIIYLKEEIQAKYQPKTVACMRLQEPYASRPELLEEAFELTARSAKQTEALLAFVQLSKKEPFVKKQALAGMANADAAREASIVVLSVPYSAHRATLEGVKDEVQGKILVDVTVPIQPPDITRVALPPGRTAAEEAQALLGSDVRVVSAFQNVSAVHLKDPAHAVDCDVLVSGDDAEAKQAVMALVEAAGMRGVDVGPLANAIVAESLTPVLLGINKRYKVKGAGIRITGIE